MLRSATAASPRSATSTKLVRSFSWLCPLSHYVLIWLGNTGNHFRIPESVVWCVLVMYLSVAGQASSVSEWVFEHRWGRMFCTWSIPKQRAVMTCWTVYPVSQLTLSFAFRANCQHSPVRWTQHWWCTLCSGSLWSSKKQPYLLSLRHPASKRRSITRADGQRLTALRHSGVPQTSFCVHLCWAIIIICASFFQRLFYSIRMKHGLSGSNHH